MKTVSTTSLAKAARVSGHVRSLIDGAFISRARRALKRNFKNCGDLHGDFPMLFALAIAEAETGRGAGGIPDCQGLACVLCELPEFKALEFIAPPDSRYVVTPEFSGGENFLYVARFCGEFLNSFETEAMAIMETHRAFAERMGYSHRANNISAAMLQGRMETSA